MPYTSVCMPENNEISVAAMRTSTESVTGDRHPGNHDERGNQDNGRGNPSGDP
jgi:hypothetical protein